MRFKRIAQQRPIFRVVVAQKCFVQAAHLDALWESPRPRSRVKYFFRGFLPEWYMAVAVAIGEGKNACT